MSCLPLFSFRPASSAVSNPYHDSSVSRRGEQGLESPDTTPKMTDGDEYLYDKLSQVSVSHRRIDSFEWVMTQSAPNTPQTLFDLSSEPFPAPTPRMVSSAPLPVPSEMWSTSSRPDVTKEKRGYFDWWSSPTLGSGEGYTRISTVEAEDKVEDEVKDGADTSSGTSIAGPTETLNWGSWAEDLASPSEESGPIRPSQELNALGILFPCTPTHNSASLELYDTHVSSIPPRELPRKTVPRTPKRVSFSPVVDEVALETFPNLDSAEQPSSYWGGYLPSSFLVARPPLARITSNPVPKRRAATRPILKHSSFSNHGAGQDVTPSTEMTQLPHSMNGTDTATSASPIPTQRLSAATLRTNGSRHVGGDPGEIDSTFVKILQVTQKPARRGCDSLLSDTLSMIGDDC
ncbi:hypothetical protein C7974DRAFT_397024 [Boeremia exigua]|uniref:uncharacterized protein n=1 Tax=Boeremia exigua TaxID=749465 RepID=UPI001E8D6EAC|nr:uncharacterized protein C7974DRAFT_397024 [Boeremia exigua]KAH6621717.1 hypothetical protein C7974DRAFT_397024 [Boeremia exigua]